eukprot:GHVU01191152.1.p1 GENE.GHVU01191152.1~~GHVU01191152.1.p1  ORF type:complete len:366 (+),score=59.70 GHVU01191152.1:309-1406(+)
MQRADCIARLCYALLCCCILLLGSAAESAQLWPAKRTLRSPPQQQVGWRCAGPEHVRGRRNTLEKLLRMRGGQAEDAAAGVGAVKDADWMHRGDCGSVGQRDVLEEQEEEEDEVGGIDNDDDDDEEEEERGLLARAAARTPGVASVLSSWRRTAPLTRGFLSASAFVTVAAFALNDGVFPEALLLHWGKTIWRGQLWRPFTAFLHLGSFGISYMLTLQFIWSHMSSLEKLHYSEPEEFVAMLGFGAASLCAAYALLQLRDTDLIGHNLSSYLLYIWSRAFEAHEVNVLDLFRIRAAYLPWVFILQSWLLEGSTPVFDIIGVATGWLYKALRRQGPLAPSWLGRAVRRSSMMREYERIGSELQAAA